MDVRLSASRGRLVCWPVSRTLGFLAVGFVAIALTAAGCGSDTTRQAAPVSGAANGPARGGELLVSVRTEPLSFSWYTQHDATTDVLTFLTQARLVRVNRVTQEIEPWLAEGWKRSEDGRQDTRKLRPNPTFADGTPGTAAPAP